MRKLSRLEKYHMNKVSMRSPSKIVAVTPAAIEFEKRAIEREKKGQFRILTNAFSNAPLSLTDNQGRERAA